ncbi:MAG: 23S rRNA (pseudouridine(1915)-N(3))-methyltransferase RlmH [Armatimonadetes bacterium]|nr:23S rRNA (pseudouridine(1915)-N(3))-methyltransferase RlmH [Armatimonadota bacterium]
MRHRTLGQATKDKWRLCANTSEAMRLTVIAFGKLRISGMRHVADHYLAGLRRWTSLEEIELKALAVPDKSAETRRMVQEREAELLLEHVEKRKARLFLLSEDGRAMTSRQWAAMLQDMEHSGVNEAVFAIGGSLGFSDRVRKRSHAVLSFGPQTLPHEMARVVLFEQLFRAWSIIKNHPYHNEG